MKYLYLHIIGFLGLFNTLCSNAQTTLSLSLKPDDVTLTYEKKHNDTLSLQAELSKIITQWRNSGYPEAACDSLVWSDSTAIAHLHQGQYWEWIALEAGNVEANLLEAIGYRERFLIKKPFNYAQLPSIMEQMLRYLENNGYPFAQVQLDNIQLDSGRVKAQFYLQRSRKVTWDGIKVEGSYKISATFLENYLDIKPGEVYNKSKLLKIATRLRELNFVQEKKPLTVTFKGEKALVNIYLEKKKASRFDLLLGVLPNNNPAAPSRLLLSFTGTADMENQLGFGEKIFASFEQLRPQTQRLDIRLAYPYIANLPFGIEGKFNLYKRDTNYLDINWDLGLQYFFEGNNYVKVFWNSMRTNLLSINEAQLRNTRRLPNILDIDNQLFGLEGQYQRLDYRFNPRKGWLLWGRLGTGRKKLPQNGIITKLVDVNDGFRYATLYDSLTLNSIQFKANVRIENYLPIGKRFTLKTSVVGGVLWSPKQPILLNEQYRLGGARSLRGFDEEALFATQYLINTLEFRLLLAQNSYLAIFGDYGYLEDTTKDKRFFNRAIGAGAGITFDTPVGLFGVSLALGSINESGFDFRAVKTHLGYISRF